MRVFFLNSAMALAAAALVGAQEPAKDTVRRAALAGYVRDLLGHPLKEVRLTVEDRNITALSNDSGYFFLGGIPAGKNDISVAKLGYLPVNFQADLAPDSTLLVNIPMRTVQALAPVDVKSGAMSAALLRDGFYDRQKAGRGSYITPDKIEKMSVTTPAQFLRDVRGVEVRCGRGGRCIVRSSPALQNSCLAVFVNRIYQQGQLDDIVSANEVFAIEVYERSVLVPIDFTLPTRAMNCGVIAVWTRTYAGG